MNLDECLIPNCTCKAKARSHTFSKSMLEHIYGRNKFYGHFPTLNTPYNPKNHEIKYISSEKATRCVSLCTPIKENRNNDSELKKIKDKKGLNLPKDIQYLDVDELSCDDLMFSLFEKRKMVDKNWLIQKEIERMGRENLTDDDFIGLILMGSNLTKYNQVILNVFSFRCYVYIYRYFLSLHSAKENGQQILKHNLCGFTEDDIPNLLRLSKEKMSIKLSYINEHMEDLLTLPSVEYIVGHEEAFNYLSSDLINKENGAQSLLSCHNALSRQGGSYLDETDLIKEKGYEEKEFLENEYKNFFPESLGIIIERNRKNQVIDFFTTSICTMKAEEKESDKFIHATQYFLLDYVPTKDSSLETEVKFSYIQDFFCAFLSPQKETKESTETFGFVDPEIQEEIDSNRRLFYEAIVYPIACNSLFYLYKNKESMESSIANGMDITEFYMNVDTFIDYLSECAEKYNRQELQKLSYEVKPLHFNRPLKFIGRKTSIDVVIAEPKE